MSRVYLFDPGVRFNTNSASSYGEVVRAYPEGISLFNTDQLTAVIFDTLRRFDPDEDFITLTGNNVVLSLAVALALSAYGRVKLLIFDARTSKYVERTIEDPSWREQHA